MGIVVSNVRFKNKVIVFVPGGMDTHFVSDISLIVGVSDIEWNEEGRLK